MGTMRAGGTAAKRGSLATRQQLGALGLAQGMAWHGAHGPWPAIAHREPLAGLPALQGARIDAGNLAGRLQPRATGMCSFDVSGQGLAIFEADHSSSPRVEDLLDAERPGVVFRGHFSLALARGQRNQRRNGCRTGQRAKPAALHQLTLAVASTNAIPSKRQRQQLWLAIDSGNRPR